MEILIYTIPALLLAYWGNRLFKRIDELERKVNFLEDRSPQAQYLRHLEDKEKGWEGDSEDLRFIVKHFQNLNSAQNLVMRALLLENPIVMEQLKAFCGRYEIENDDQRIFVRSIEELIVPREE